MNHTLKSPHTHIAQQFYAGMTQATLDARNNIQPLIIKQFEKRELHGVAEQTFSKIIYFRKRLLSTHNGLLSAPIEHGVSRFSLEYFCCISALNLFRLSGYVERFKADLQTESFYAHCCERELEWLGVYNADLPYFKQDTGYTPGMWRIAIIKSYLIELGAKSSRDADTLVAIRRFLHRQQLSKGAGVDVTPAMQEACAHLLENNANWLEHYLQFHAW